MKNKFTIVAACLCFSVSNAQTSGVQWKKNYGGSSTDQAKSVCKTNDGGYVSVGFTESTDVDVVGQHGVRDIFAVKTNSLGTIVWKRTIGGTANDEGMSVIQKSDGDLLITGYTESNTGDFVATPNLPHRGGKDLFVVRLNPDGTTDWIKKFGGTGEEGGACIKEDAGGNILVAGYTSSNDFDVTGNHLNGSSTTLDYWVLKLDNTGAVVWKKVFGGSKDAFNASGEDKATAITTATNGDCYVTGYSRSVDGDITAAIDGKDIWTLKLNGSTGAIIWQKTTGGTGWEEANSIDLTSAGNIIIAGYTQSNDVNVSGNHGLGSKDIWVSTMSATNGSLTAQKCLGGGAEENAYCIRRTTDNGYILCGYSSSSTGDITSSYGGWDWWVVKLNANLSIAWQKNIGGSLTELGAYGVVESNDGGYLLAGIASNLFEGTSGQFYGSEDFWLVKLANPSVGLSDHSMEMNISVYPVPSAGNVNIVFKKSGTHLVTVYDLQGKCVYSDIAIEKNYTLETGQFNGGIYYLVATANDGLSSRKTIHIVK